VFHTSAEVRRRYGGVSDMWISRRLNDNSGFPKPLVINRRRFWRLSELLAWEQKRAAASKPKPTSRSARGNLSNPADGVDA
jgi:predicted DNA-binding transcriptional regulator AlpA